MDIIFLDTSIFEANNFLEGNRIKEVFKLAERGDIKILIPKLTYDEILNRVSKNIDEAIKKIDKYRNDTRVLRNIGSLSGKFEPFDGNKAKGELKENIDEKFLRSKFEIIDYPTLDIEDVFKSYFNKRPPFGLGDKKNEFPDAFALKTIEIWAEKHNEKVLVFSKDSDMLSYESNYLIIVEDFEQYLSNKTKEIESLDKKNKVRLEKIDFFIKNQSGSIKKGIEDWVESQLDDFTKYDDYTNYYEVYDIQIDEIKINVVNYTITNITTEEISVELRVSINFKLGLTIDDEDYMYKDDDTKEWVFLETKVLPIDEIRNIDVDISFLLKEDDDNIYGPEIFEYNKGRMLNI